MKEKKDVSRSVRMTPTTYNYVLRMDGKSFNDKFNKMVDFCMTREKVLYSQVKELEKKKESLEKKILKEEQLLKYIDEIRQISEEMMKNIRGC